ncbi:MAG: alginate lyase family protein [Acidimicrobiia bacterium]|nr:alginate lyase family protein [Acidimicrobiia bacterium]
MNSGFSRVTSSAFAAAILIVTVSGCGDSVVGESTATTGVDVPAAPESPMAAIAGDEQSGAPPAAPPTMRITVETTSTVAPSTAEETTTTAPDVPDRTGIWLDPRTVVALPTDGPAWEAVRRAALADWEEPNLDDGGNDHDVELLAGALYATRTGDEAMRRKVENGLAELTGTTVSEVLPLARNLLAYVIAADLIDYRAPEFTQWLKRMIDLEADGRAGHDSLRQSALSDPSNHGTHARASVLAVALFVGDDELTGTVADRFHDWLGRSGDGFVWKERDWQSDPANPRAINPPGARIGDLSVDGVLPEEQRRSGGFRDPAPREGYVWEALQGAVATAEMLDKAGYPAWDWQDRAILRAFRWLHQVNDFPAEGDDVWQTWLVNHAYGTNFAARLPTRPGKNLGYTDWTHQ